MKKFLIISLLSLLASCGTTANRSGPGFIYTETTDPIAFDNSVRSHRTGEACSTRILGLVATGDASLQAAKSEANISRVAVANTKYFNILGVYGKACTVVKGE